MPRLFQDPVTIGTLSFNTGVRDSEGVTWFLDGLVGWDHSAEPNVILNQFGYSDGAVAGARFPLKEKYVEVTGVCRAPDRATAERAWRKILYAFDHNLDIEIIRNGPIPEKMLTRLAARLEKTQDIGKTFRWATTVVAPWPFKTGSIEFSAVTGVFTGGSFYRTYTDSSTKYRTYPRTYVNGDQATASGISDFISFNNAGNAAAYPVYEVTGPLVANTWDLINEANGETLSFAADISTGQTLVIDTKNKEATLGGVAVDYYIRGDWVKAPPGNNVFRLATAEPNPSARLRVRAADTWR